jgi:spermidine synthase
LSRGVRGTIALLAAAFFSGAAGLMYQVAWTRRLMTTTSATAAAQALVVGVFLAGLAIGAGLAGRASRRLRSPIRWYAAAEIGASMCAAISIPAIDRSQSLSTSVALTLFFSSLFLLFVATLLGASLPLMIAEAERVERNARTAALIYGLNTFGAAIGAIASGFFTIERFGLTGTTWIGTMTALVAVAIALVIGRASNPDWQPSGDISRRSETRWRPILVSALAGFVGVGAEIVFTRLLALLFKNTVYVFASVLVGVLIGIALGAVIVSALKSLARASMWSAVVAGLAGAAAWMAVAPPLLPWIEISDVFNTSIAQSVASGSIAAMSTVVLFIAPLIALSALALPALAAAVADASDARAFGDLYAANTFGSVLGSFIAGFVLLPLLGVASAVLILSLAALLGCFVMIFGPGVPIEGRSRGWARGIVAAAALVVAVAHAASDIPRSIYEARLPDSVKVLEFAEGTVSDVMVTEESSGRRRLWINSSWVAGTGGGHRVLGLLPGLFVEKPRRALGIALGTGQTFAAVLRHGFESLDCVEINPNVIALSSRWFSEANDGLFRRPGVRVHTDDGRAFLRTTEDRFELIVLEPLQAWTAGTSSLYTREFYESAKRVLSPGGIVAQWIPFYGQSEADTRAMVRAGIDVFPNASLWLDENDGILILSDAPLSLDPQALYARARARGIDRLLLENNIDSAADLVALFLLGSEGARRWAGDARILDDDHPFLEFDAARRLFSPNAKEIFASARQNAEGPEAYLVQSSTTALAIGRTAHAIQTALLDAGMLPLDDYTGRARAFERGLIDAPSSSLLRSRREKLKRAR